MQPHAQAMRCTWVGLHVHLHISGGSSLRLDTFFHFHCNLVYRLRSYPGKIWYLSLSIHNLLPIFVISLKSLFSARLCFALPRRFGTVSYLFP